MNDLRTAAQQALEAYSRGPNWQGFYAAMEDLRAALAQERQTSHSAEQERGMAQPFERTCGQQTARKLSHE